MSYTKTRSLMNNNSLAGTTDVTVMHINDGHFTVQATGGSSHCGGMHLDSLILTFLLRKLEESGLGIGLQVLSAAMSVNLPVYVADSHTMREPTRVISVKMGR